jgi:hypothetical protein
MQVVPAQPHPDCARLAAPLGVLASRDAPLAVPA